MKSLGRVALVGGMAAWAALAQVDSVNTISAKPGAVNYVEGSVSINGNTLSASALRSTFLNAGDLLSTKTGKAEVLLTPGVFLRVGENSEVRMVSPSLTDTQVQLDRGELMIEATGLVNGNHLQIVDNGSTTSITKNGLYRFIADNPPLVAVLDGKARVNLDDRQVDLKKGRELVIADNAKTQKFDTKQTDDLYAWSNVRSEYEAAASYRVAQSANAGTLAYGGYGLGPGVYGSGWYWDYGFGSYAWLPGAGAFYSPFGYGFYSPGLVGYAPVVVAPVYAGGGGYGYRHDHDGDHHWHHGPVQPGGNHPGGTTRPTMTAAVPVRPGNSNGFFGNRGSVPSPAFSAAGSHPSYSGVPHPSFNGASHPSFSGASHPSFSGASHGSFSAAPHAGFSGGGGGGGGHASGGHGK